MPPPVTNAPTVDAKTDAAARKKQDSHHDVTREIFETVVFVVVLVLMLKLFVAEAFVIPTGSMASTLWGDQDICTCRECGHSFPINASESGERRDITDYWCENCGFVLSRGIDDSLAEEKKHLPISEFDKLLHDKMTAALRKDLDGISSGDRVLVSKYEYHMQDPKRFEVPVFKFPQEPFSEKEKQGMNYIKRLVGLGGETLAVFNGDLYTTRELTYDHIERSARPQRQLDAWWPQYMYPNDSVAAAAFREGKFAIVRKEPRDILAMRRSVFNLDEQPKSLSGVRRTRWQIDEEQGAGWEMLQTEKDKGFKHSGNDEGFVLYQHVDPWSIAFQNNPPFQQKKVDADKSKDPRYFVVDCLGYNQKDIDPFTDNYKDHWVADLIIDCNVEIPSPDAQVVLELGKGRDRFQAVFTKGVCTLVRITTGPDGKSESKEMGSHPTKMTKGGEYALRLANVDCRLTVWVDNKPIPFAREQSDYRPPIASAPVEPFVPNDLLQPARIGARGEVKVTHVRLWRDLLYRCGWPNLPNPDGATKEADRRRFERQKLDMILQWKDIPNKCGDVQTYYVQPGHFLMFGDNVNSSADSRSWGTVPNRLMLGRAVVIYFPLSRMGVIE